MVRGFCCHGWGARWSEARPGLGRDGGGGTRSLRPDGVRLGLGTVVKRGLMIWVRSSRRVLGSLEGSECDSAIRSCVLVLICLDSGVKCSLGSKSSMGRPKMSVILRYGSLEAG